MASSLVSTSEPCLLQSLETVDLFVPSGVYHCTEELVQNKDGAYRYLVSRQRGLQSEDGEASEVMISLDISSQLSLLGRLMPCLR